MAHWERRRGAVRRHIVCMSRRICVEMYALTALPEWHSDDDKGKIKVVMTGDA